MKPSERINSRALADCARSGIYGWLVTELWEGSIKNKWKKYRWHIFSGGQCCLYKKNYCWSG